MSTSDKILFSHSSPDSTSEVTVIVSLYNYAQYIEQALDSVKNQTLKNMSIVIVDDCSQDQSAAIAKQWLIEHCTRFCDSLLLVHETNKKLPSTRNTALRYSKTPYVCILDADNILYPRCLEALLDGIRNSGASFAYCITEKFGSLQEDVFNLTPWNPSLLKQGNIIDAMALIRKDILDRVGAYSQLDEGMEDYDLWIKIAKIGGWGIQIPEILARYRDHRDSLSATKTIPNKKYIIDFLKETHPSFFGSLSLLRPTKPELEEDELQKEIYKAKLQLNEKSREVGFLKAELRSKDRALTFVYASKSWKLTKPMRRLLLFAKQMKAVFASGMLLRARQSVHPRTVFFRSARTGTKKSKERKKHLLIVVHELELGGAQLFAIRLANFLEKTYRVYIYCVRPQCTTPAVIGLVSEGVELLDSSGSAEELRAYILSLGIDVVNSHFWWSDKLVHEALAGLSTPWIITLHGSYEFFYAYPDQDETFLNRVREVVHRANTIVYVAEKNTSTLKSLNVVVDEKKCEKIYYGYKRAPAPVRTRQELGIPANSFVYGIVSRAIPQKGWKQAIHATIQLNSIVHADTHLILVGESEYAEELRRHYQDFPFIHFVGSSTTPGEWIPLFNVGLLPTYCIEESLPNTIIEYLFYGVPVIATDIGEIRNMLCSSTHEAGIVISLTDKQGVDTVALMKAMRTILEDKNLLATFKRNTPIFASQFDMAQCARRYTSLIERNTHNEFPK